jgi:excisionase family DNA binding protein
MRTELAAIHTPTLCSIPSALARTGIGRSFLYERLADGSIRSVKAGRRRLVDVASLDQWAASLPESQLKQTAKEGQCL